MYSVYLLTTYSIYLIYNLFNSIQFIIYLLLCIQSFMYTVQQILAFCWSSSNAFVSGAGSLRFKSRSGQIEQSVANGLHRCKISSKRAALPGRNDAEMGPANSLHASAHC